MNGRSQLSHKAYVADCLAVLVIKNTSSQKSKCSKKVLPPLLFLSLWFLWFQEKKNLVSVFINEEILDQVHLITRSDITLSVIYVLYRYICTCGYFHNCRLLIGVFYRQWALAQMALPSSIRMDEGCWSWVQNSLSVSNLPIKIIVAFHQLLGLQ